MGQSLQFIDIFQGAELQACSLNTGKESEDRWLVTFAEWGREGRSDYFAKSFAQRNGLRAICVKSTRNCWWNSLDFPGLLATIRDTVGNDQMLHYGASMGGYGALYASAMIGGAAICFSPQVIVTSNGGLEDPRWRKEWDNITAHFDEEWWLKRTRTEPLLVFADRTDQWDSKHLQALEACRPQNAHIIDVPYGLHVPIRLAQASGFLKPLLLDVLKSRSLDLSALGREAALAYRTLPRSFAHYVRKNPGRVTLEDLKKLEQEFLEHHSDDFEYCYMVAEAAAAHGLSRLALTASWRSLTLGPLVGYQLSKHADILQKTAGTNAAAHFLQGYRSSDVFSPQLEDRLKKLTDACSIRTT